MRAMYNPTRMSVIEKATGKLLDKINSQCPSCNMPGFDITDTKRGLPCSWCGNPTRSIVSVISRCKHCGYEMEKKYPDNKKFEDPMYCDECNP